jgi:hypothetical protein
MDVSDANIVGPRGTILDTLREKLKDEPCLKEFPGFRRVREIVLRNYIVLRN